MSISKWLSNSRSILNKDFTRFLISGGVNTIITYILYLVLLLALTYQISYTISYVVGIFISYYINTKFVFRTTLNWKKAVQYPVVYVFQYIMNSIVIYIWVEIIHMGSQLAPIIAIALSIPITFVVSRLIILGRRST